MAVRYLQEKSVEAKEPGTEKGQTLPEYLRQLRHLSHYRQNFVAAKLNISRQTYSHYETGRIRPPAGALYSLAKLYEVPVESLLSCMMLGQYGIESNKEKYENTNHINTEGENASDYVPKDKDMNQMEEQLLSRFRSLSESDREDILSIVELKSKKAEHKIQCH